MIDIEQLKSKTSILEKTNDHIKMLETMDSAHFKNGNTLEVTVKSSVFGTISIDKILTYQSAKKYITPFLEIYKEKQSNLLTEIENIMKGGD